MKYNNLFFSSITDEIQANIPFLPDVFEAIIGEVVGEKRATIVTIYGMIMHSRNMQASAIQRIWTAAAIKCHADNKLLQRLNKVHITLSAESKKNIVKEFSTMTETNICKEIQSGKRGKINGDNLDLHVKTNDVRMTNHDKDYHFFASDWTPFRLVEDDFVSNTYLQQYLDKQRDKELSLCKFFPSDAEIVQFVEAVKILVGREVLTHCSSFKWMDLVLPKHIHHDLSDIMSRKSSSYVMPILLQNESRYEDCLNILEVYRAQIVRWYHKIGRGNELESLRVPIGGDQLTRVRFDGARCLKMGAHTAEERFANLEPMIVQLFHVLMDFLEVPCTMNLIF
ncbi:hypothetical protein KP79_PYT00398 [Mizuhopecten yessoensis]|uniref:DUF6589 domain-containing protein n=1 Tax=Mizuhopecten yessoensis TaxID=6573 RepID=A0A210QYM3_MIZYE|nr:hypothetical protein KP79_PYT00398 [Mizuhopecten yessoensis]